MLENIAGNGRCMDCGIDNPQWAGVSYGTLLCIECSSRHRRLGVRISVVKSIHMDSWSHKEVLNMLEGGNEQLSAFFERHQLGEHNSLVCADMMDTVKNRYKTNAALFYRKNLAMHVEKVVSPCGEYKGREAFRAPFKKKNDEPTGRQKNRVSKKKQSKSR